MASVNTKLLLGWMDEAEAMTSLLKECRREEPFTDQSARDLWNEYRQRVAALGARPYVPPLRLADRTAKEEYAEHHFMQKHAKNANILGVAKLDDPGKLVVHQLSVVVPQSEIYLEAMQNPKKRVHTSLGRGLGFDGVHPKARREGTRLLKAVPHAEFSVSTIKPDDFDLIENNRHIAIKEFDGRMMLAAGYHRAHISMYRNNPDDTVLPLFAGLESDADGFFSANSVVPFKRDMVLGACPPLLSDFFDDSLCIQLPLRKCRVEMCVDFATQQWSRLWLDADE
jgi:hypothetical protein